MRKINKERVAEALGITEEGMDEFLKRQKGLLMKRGKISAVNLLQTYAFLIEIKEREKEASDDCQKCDISKIFTDNRRPLFGRIRCSQNRKVSL